jgi:hypothetical protein
MGTSSRSASTMLRTSHPPGRSTPRSAASAAGISERGSMSSEKNATTASNKPSETSSSVASRRRNPASGTLARARESITGEMSMPVTSAPAATSWRAVGSPVPHPTSSTRAWGGSRSMSHWATAIWPSLWGNASS